MMIRVFFYCFFLFVAFPLTAQEGSPITAQETFIDPRDKNIYKIKTYTRSVGMDVIMSQTWMIENLQFETKEAYCYDNNPENCKQYGRLYTWEAALTACPKGWRLPTDLEWQGLVHQFSLGGLTTKGKKEVYQQLIKGGTSGFEALFGGRGYSNSEFFNQYTYGGYWSGTENGVDNAWYYGFSEDNGEVNRSNYYDKSSAYSCRCVKD